MSDTNEEDKLEQLLIEWDFGELFHTFLVEGITIELLKDINETDLAYLFQNRKLGEKIRFRKKLLEWKKENEFCSLDNSSISLDVQITQTSDVNHKESRKDVFDLFEILREHYSGVFVISTFNETKKLNNNCRKILIEAIVNWHVKKNLKITKPDFICLAKQIQATFNDDQNIYFSQIGTRNTGRLYDKYYNTIKRLKKSGEVLSNPGNAVVKNEGSQLSINLINEDDIQSAYDWLKNFSEPWTNVQESWKITFNLRRKNILSTECNILSDWNLFTHSLGHDLVNIDFKYLYPEAPSFKLKWEGSHNKLVNILNEKISAIPHLELLHLVNVNDKGSDVYKALLLHALLRPQPMRSSTKKDRLKSTIADSQLAFLLHVKAVNDVENKLEQMRTNFYTRGETIQPIIVAVGLTYSVAKFYVYFDTIKYELPTFLTAFDICFKTFQVLNLKYPRDSVEFWTFVQKYYYNIHLTDDKPSPNLLSLVSDLN